LIQQLPITVLIIAKNEESNIGRCLATPSLAADMIVFDSYSQDRAENSARERDAEVIQFQYEGR